MCIYVSIRHTHTPHTHKHTHIFRILQIFKGLLQTKNVKKCNNQNNYKVKRTINLLKRKIKKAIKSIKKILYHCKEYLTVKP